MGGATGTCTSPPNGVGDSSWAYNDTGTVNTMTDNVGTSQSAQSNHSYDADGRPVTVTDDNGNVVNYAYNDAGQVTCVGYPGLANASTNCSQPAGSSNTIVTFGYDSAARLNSTTDWLGHETTYGYSTNGLSDLTSVTYPTTGSDSITYGYDAGSLLTSATYGASSLSSIPAQSWQYDADNLVKTATQLDSSGGTISSYTAAPTYDVSPNTLQRNWVASNTNPGASGADSYGYNPNGELASDAHGQSATSYTYNGDAGADFRYQSDNELRLHGRWPTLLVGDPK